MKAEEEKELQNSQSSESEFTNSTTQVFTNTTNVQTNAGNVVTTHFLSYMLQLVHQRYIQL